MTEQRNGQTRRQTLECLTWAGAGVLWTVAGGVPRSALLGSAEAAEPATGLRFVQISDSHIGFKNAPNPDTQGTLGEAVDLVRRTKGDAGFMIHTGDVSHLSRQDQFDTAEHIIGTAGLQTHYVPGEHDVIEDGGKSFLSRFASGHEGGWQSWDEGGVHFVGLNNVVELKAGGMGSLGADQLAWLRRDLEPRSASTPVVVFAHIPLWIVSAEWGWGTDDSGAALDLLRRFGSVTVLNGHIHQIMQKVEGNIRFHTARSTAFPQPAPGTAPSPGPIKDVPPGKLREMLGVSRVELVPTGPGLAIVDATLAG